MGLMDAYPGGLRGFVRFRVVDLGDIVDVDGMIHKESSSFFPSFCELVI